MISKENMVLFAATILTFLIIIAGLIFFLLEHKNTTCEEKYSKDLPDEVTLLTGRFYLESQSHNKPEYDEWVMLDFKSKKGKDFTNLEADVPMFEEENGLFYPIRDMNLQFEDKFTISNLVLQPIQNKSEILKYVSGGMVSKVQERNVSQFLIVKSDVKCLK